MLRSGPFGATTRPAARPRAYHHPKQSGPVRTRPPRWAGAEGFMPGTSPVLGTRMNGVQRASLQSPARPLPSGTPATQRQPYSPRPSYHLERDTRSGRQTGRVPSMSAGYRTSRGLLLLGGSNPRWPRRRDERRGVGELLAGRRYLPGGLGEARGRSQQGEAEQPAGSEHRLSIADSGRPQRPALSAPARTPARSSAWRVVTMHWPWPPGPPSPRAAWSACPRGSPPQCTTSRSHPGTGRGASPPCLNT